VTGIAERLLAVRARIADAARANGRLPESVRLVAVSKTKPVSAIREAYAAGQRDFGENYVQELTAKASELSDLPDLVFHFIGHLQRNKAKAVVGAARAVHTVDSARLAAELGKRARESTADAAPVDGQGAEDPRLAVFVEVNVGGEASKSGCTPLDLPLVLEAVDQEPALRLIGLMTVPPFTEDPHGARPYFDALVNLRDTHGGAARLPELSMGMTHDLEQAVAAGATLVRVGTAIFGGRG
jgi:pyridoxal phosphate enzyme (YggS family)